jgi:hypothetical protein
LRGEQRNHTPDRLLARPSLSAAKQTFDARVRASLVETAQRWLDLAERSEHDGWNEALRLRAAEAAIGHEFRALYALPSGIPHRLFTLLTQLDAQGETN